MIVSAPPSISTIIVNLSDTVVAGIPGVEARLSERFGIDSESVIPAFCHPSADGALLGHISEVEYLENVIATGRWTISIDDLRQALFENFRSVVPGMPELLEELTKREFTLILESNHIREWIEQIDACHPFLADIFPRRFFSFETGRLNKVSDAFEKMATSIGKAPSECLYVGNSEKSCEAAKEAGMQTIRFQNVAELRQNLADLNLI